MAPVRVSLGRLTPEASDAASDVLFGRIGHTWPPVAFADAAEGFTQTLVTAEDAIVVAL